MNPLTPEQEQTQSAILMVLMSYRQHLKENPLIPERVHPYIDHEFKEILRKQGIVEPRGMKEWDR
jgi:hypothetical protein